MKNLMAVHHGQKPLRWVSLLLMILPAVSLPAGTQADVPKSTSAQAVLHVQVHVVPVSQLPPGSPTMNLAHGSVVYNIPANSPQMDVTKEIHLMPSGVAGVAGVSGGKAAVLETTTVVPH